MLELMLTVHLWPVGRLARKRLNRWDCFGRWMPSIWRMPRLCFGKSVGQVCSAGRDMELLELGVSSSECTK